MKRILLLIALTLALVLSLATAASAHEGKDHPERDHNEVAKEAILWSPYIAIGGGAVLLGCAVAVRRSSRR